MNLDGIFLIDKEKGYTSFDVCAKVRKKLNIKKVGHSGTLDPFATGLMIVAVNNATKLLRFFEAEKKTCIASLYLGKETDTLDLTGKKILEKDVPNLTKENVEKVLSSFLGKSEQIPPKYSALRVNGRKLYDYARNNEEIEIKKREINVYEIKLISFTNNVLTFLSTVSKGTYIRSLGKDIAKKLGTCGHLIDLRRTSIGELKVDDAKKINDINESDILDSKNALTIPKIDIDEKTFFDVKNGKNISFECDFPIISLLFNNKIVAIYEKINLNLYHCLRGINIENN